MTKTLPFRFEDFCVLVLPRIRVASNTHPSLGTESRLPTRELGAGASVREEGKVGLCAGEAKPAWGGFLARWGRFWCIMSYRTGKLKRESFELKKGLQLTEGEVQMKLGSGVALRDRFVGARLDLNVWGNTAKKPGEF